MLVQVYGDNAMKKAVYK